MQGHQQAEQLAGEAENSICAVPSKGFARTPLSVAIPTACVPASPKTHPSLQWLHLAELPSADRRPSRSCLPWLWRHPPQAVRLRCTRPPTSHPAMVTIITPERTVDQLDHAAISSGERAGALSRRTVLEGQPSPVPGPGPAGLSKQAMLCPTPSLLPTDTVSQGPRCTRTRPASWILDPQPPPSDLSVPHKLWVQVAFSANSCKPWA